MADKKYRGTIKKVLNILIRRINIAMYDVQEDNMQTRLTLRMEEYGEICCWKKE